MDGKNSGIVTWMATIRTAMANDSGRQFFEDQVQTQGFLFLDEYLHNIRAGSKQESAIVELVKTPGRKRNAPKKTRAAAAAAARAQTAISLSLEDDDFGKENFAPVNKFHQALLQAKEAAHEDQQESSLQRQSQGPVPAADSPTKAQSKYKSVKVVEAEEALDQEEHFIDISSSPQPHADALPDVEEEEEEVMPVPLTNLLAPRTDVGNELSVIAEDDEPAERSKASAHPPHVSPRRSVQPLPSIALPPPRPGHESGDFEEEDVTTAFHDADMEIDDRTRATAITVSDSTNTFPSIPLSPPQTSHPSERSREPSPRGAMTTEEGEVYSMPSNPIFRTTDISVPVRDHDSKPTLAHKTSLSQFTGLPQPSPLRKSTRVVPEPFLRTSAPGPALIPGGGKRSSWFSKAREANSKRVSTTAGAASGSTTLVAAHLGGMKRKSGEMIADLAPGQRNSSSTDDTERKHKLPKTSNDITEALGDAEAMEVDVTVSRAVQFLEAPVPGGRPTKSADDISTQPQKGVFGDFKKAVEGLGARAGKSVGKPLGGDAAAAAELAKARAVAEARVAERQKRDGTEADVPVVRQSLSAPDLTSAGEPWYRSSRPTVSESDRRLSVSDLVFNSKVDAKESKEQLKIPSITVSKSHISDVSTSTTPPDSPPVVKPTAFVPPSAPVFNKPPPVFVLPPAAEPSSSQPANGGLMNEFSFKLPMPTSFPPRAPFDLGLQPSSSKLSSSPRAKPLSGTSSKSSLYSDPVFDSQPAWAPSTQDTAYTSQDTAEFKYREQSDARMNDLDDDDDDDSWRLDEKLAATDQQWTPFGAVLGKEDSMTWSTVPSESQHGGHSGPLSGRFEESAGPSKVNDAPIPEQRQPTPVLDELMDEDINELADVGGPTVGLVGGKASAQPVRSESQMSMVSSSDESSQPGGFFGQATKLVSSMLGVNKKDKGPVKSIQLAAAVAKKHQEEQDRKTVRLKEMEARRQAALQRKADEEKLKAEEAEKKAKDEAERRKKDREEQHTGKRPLKAVEKKVNEEDTKRKKVVVEIEKPKPTLKEKKDPAPTRMTKPSPNPSLSQAKPKALSKQPSSSSMHNVAGASTSKLGTAEKKTLKVAPSSLKGKGKARAPKDESDVEDKAPSKVVQSQMAARMKAQVQASKPDAPPPITSESIELPEPNSEYSDSEDENRRGFDAPDWAQSPEVLEQLGRQKTLDPDDIFGPIRPLHMEDIFRTRQSRFRARTSSANWSGPDGLTELESREYAKRMGFK